MTVGDRGLRNVVVVGGSVSGTRTAMALRRMGYDGRLRIISAEDALYYYRPNLSKRFLSGEQTEQDLALPLADDLDIEVWSGTTAIAADCLAKRLTVQRAEETIELDYDGLVIATGLTPRRPPMPPLNGIHYVRELADAQSLRAELATGPRVVVIGGGLVGCEVAATCRKLGLDVAIVETADNLLESVLGPRAGQLVTQVHQANGVRVYTGVGVSSVVGRHHVESVTLSTGEQLAADVLVVAVGSLPRTDWLTGSGLHIDDGVSCAPNLCALGADSVVAVGDVARFEDPGSGRTVRIEHWENAMRQADTAARTMLEGPDSPPYVAQTTFWSTQYDLQLHVMGLVRHTDELRVAEGSLEELCGVATYHRGDRVTGILALNQPQRLRAYRHLLDVSDRGVTEAAHISQGVQ